MGKERKKTEATNLPGICYKRNYLTSVIARLDFATPIQSIAEELPRAVFEKAVKAFPLTEPKEVYSKEFQLEPVMKAMDKKSMEWHFYGNDREKHLAFTNRAFFIDYKRYDKYEVFKRDFTDISEILFKEFPNAVTNRLGLRFVNIFEKPGGNPFNWKGYFNKYLLCTNNFYQDKTVIARAFNVIEFNFDRFKVRFQFGMYNPDYPASIKKKHFLLDFDAYYYGWQEHSEVAQNLDVYHDKIQELFEACITDKLKEEMLNA